MGGCRTQFADLAATLDVTDRYLRRVFRRNSAWRRSVRADAAPAAAKRPLIDTGLSILDIAMASGFASLRRSTTSSARYA
jgi:transcriptional regulator GlxA family with amidase domain